MRISLNWKNSFLIHWLPSACEHIATSRVLGQFRRPHILFLSMPDTQLIQQRVSSEEPCPGTWKTPSNIPKPSKSHDYGRESFFLFGLVKAGREENSLVKAFVCWDTHCWSNTSQAFHRRVSGCVLWWKPQRALGSLSHILWERWWQESLLLHTSLWLVNITVGNPTWHINQMVGEGIGLYYCEKKNIALCVGKAWVFMRTNHFSVLPALLNYWLGV